jgi:hypothetical protein
MRKVNKGKRERVGRRPTCDVVFVTAEGTLFGGFELERAELLVDDLPDNFVG